MNFTDRIQAGKKLAELLGAYSTPNSIVIGLARGGVVIAKAVSEALAVPLDVLVVKKIGSPENPEFALGALAPDGATVINWPLAHRMGIDEAYMNDQIEVLSEQIRQKITLYRKGRKPLNIQGKTVIIVDDGAATGATLEAAIKWARKKGARRVIAAVPVAPPETVAKVRPETDEFIVIEIPAKMTAVGQFFKQFPQMSDAEVIQLLK